MKVKSRLKLIYYIEMDIKVLLKRISVRARDNLDGDRIEFAWSSSC